MFCAFWSSCYRAETEVLYFTTMFAAARRTRKKSWCLNVAQLFRAYQYARNKTNCFTLFWSVCKSSMMEKHKDYYSSLSPYVGNMGGEEEPLFIFFLCPSFSPKWGALLFLWLYRLFGLFSESVADEPNVNVCVDIFRTKEIPCKTRANWSLHSRLSLSCVRPFTGSLGDLFLVRYWCKLCHHNRIIPIPWVCGTNTWVSTFVRHL